jgi:hypothetical protein
MDKIMKTKVSDISKKIKATNLSTSQNKAVAAVTLSTIKNITKQINTLKGPVHPSYKQFIDRLNKFLENEKSLTKLGNKVSTNEKFMELLEQENFDNSSIDELHNILQDNLLESFAEETIENFDQVGGEISRETSVTSSISSISSISSTSSTSSIDTIENFDEELSSYKSDPLMTILIYVVLAYLIYMVYKNYGK